MKIDITRPVQTRVNCEVKLCGIDENIQFPIFGYVKQGSGIWSPQRWTIEGKALRGDCDYEHDLDLIYLPEVLKGWVNVYRFGEGPYRILQGVFSTENDARDFGIIPGGSKYIGAYEFQITVKENV